MTDIPVNPCTVDGSSCEDHFVTRKSMVAVFIIVLGLMSGCVAWAIAINSAVAAQNVTNVEQDKKLEYISSLYGGIDGKLNKILDNQELIKAKK